MSVRLKRAGSLDARRILALDELSRQNGIRRAWLKRSISNKTTYLIESGSELLGYAVLSPSFFGQPFLEMLYFAPDQRRKSYGTQALSLLEDIARDAGGLWTSTNTSNRAMRQLLKKAGYVKRGKVEVDLGDAEVFFFKSLSPDSVSTPRRRAARATFPR